MGRRTQKIQARKKILQIKQSAAMNPPGLRLSRELRLAAAMCERKPRTYYSIFKMLTSRSHNLLILALSVPFLFPVALPGVSMFIGFWIAIAGYRMGLGKGPWLPRKLLLRKAPPKLTVKFFHFCEILSSKLELFVRPRAMQIYRYQVFQYVNGLIVVVCGLLMTAPLPPGTNFPPAVVLTLISVANLEQDGFMMTAAYFAFLVNLAFFAALGILGVEGIKALVTSLQF